MTLTAIHNPQKQADLDAAVRATAIFSGAGLVGVLTSGPARLALLPFAGGPGETVEVAVESPQDLALLSRDVAVVRSADGSLWSLAGLGAEPRVRQIGRDVRVLAPRAAGDSALSLHQDGSAGAVTLSRQEVAVRSFTVRGGALRACAVGESVTHVVLDGDGGAQLRIHPGATPELGTSAKVALPAEARDLGELRAGHALSVLHKRGSASLCVISGSPSKLVARMVELDAKVADTVVIDDALIVAFADGRLALYDEAMLAETAGGLLAPTFALTPAARGKPRALATAIIKGHPVLWIATTAGEVLRAPLARDGEKAEAPPAPKPAAPREDLRAELSAARQALAEAEATRAEQAARADAAEEARLAAERGHAATMDAQRADREQEILALRATHAAALDALAAEHAQAVEALRDELTGERATHADARARTEAAHAAAIDAQRAAHAETIDRSTTSHRDELTFERAAHAEAIARIEEAHAATMGAQRADRAQEILALRATHAAALEALAAEHGHAVEALRVERAAALEAVVLEHARATEALVGGHAAILEGMAAGHRAALEASEVAQAAALDGERAIQARTEEQFAVARAQIERLGAELQEAAQRAASAAAERDAVAADLDALRTELLEERAKLDRDFVKWGEMTISLDRARGAVDSMLARAQTVFGKK